MNDYMKIVFILIALFFIFERCNKENNKSISIYFENNSDLDSSLIIDTYINGSVYKAVTIKRNSQKIYDTSLKASFNQKKNKNLQLMFIVESSKDTTSCIIPADKIDSVYYLHVNYVRTVLQKGFVIYNRVLDKDSIAYRGFDCEPIFKRSSP